MIKEYGARANHLAIGAPRPRSVLGPISSFSSTDEDQDDREDVRRHCRVEGGAEAEGTAGGSAHIAKPKGRPSDTEERHEKRYHGELRALQ